MDKSCLQLVVIPGVLSEPADGKESRNDVNSEAILAVAKKQAKTTMSTASLPRKKQARLLELLETRDDPVNRFHQKLVHIGSRMTSLDPLRGFHADLVGRTQDREKCFLHNGPSIFFCKSGLLDIAPDEEPTTRGRASPVDRFREIRRAATSEQKKNAMPTPSSRTLSITIIPRSIAHNISEASTSRFESILHSIVDFRSLLRCEFGCPLETQTELLVWMSPRLAAYSACAGGDLDNGLAKIDSAIIHALIRRGVQSIEIGSAEDLIGILRRLISTFVETVLDDEESANLAGCIGDQCASVAVRRAAKAANVFGISAAPDGELSKECLEKRFLTSQLLLIPGISADVAWAIASQYGTVGNLADALELARDQYLLANIVVNPMTKRCLGKALSQRIWRVFGPSSNGTSVVMNAR